MISSFDIQNLDKLLKDFHTAVGIRISIFDNEFQLVTEYPKVAPSFCTLIRSTEAGERGCHKCDMEACERARKMRKPHIYTCHAGITEAITPIQLGGGVIGYAILAHMLPTENYKGAVKNACDLAENYGLSRQESLRVISSITSKSTEEIHAAVSLLDAVSSYVYIKNFAIWKNEDISSDIEKYIKSNLSEQLSSELLCRQFNVSRSNLYQISLRAFGMGIKQYIAYCRIERAKQLLLEERSILEIAETCGYGEYNYFCKVFKKATGISPSTYRKSKRNV